jgi:hypothetical protein
VPYEVDVLLAGDLKKKLQHGENVVDKLPSTAAVTAKVAPQGQG